MGTSRPRGRPLRIRTGCGAPLPPSDEGGGFCAAKDGGRDTPPRRSMPQGWVLSAYRSAGKHPFPGISLDKGKKCDKIIQLKALTELSTARSHEREGTVRALGDPAAHATPEHAPDEGDGPSPLPDDVRCPSRDNQGGTASVSLPLSPDGAFLFVKEKIKIHWR